MVEKPRLVPSDPLTPNRLTSREAAKRLGVKRATLYAYVSRGVLGRELASDGRSSLFYAEEIDSLRRGRGAADEGEIISAVDTSITRVDDAGLWVRGQDLTCLADSSYEHTVDMLWQSGEGENWKRDGAAAERAAVMQAALPRETEGALRLRAILTLAAALDPLRYDLSAFSLRAAGRSMIALMVDALPQRTPPQGQRLADRFWSALSGEASEKRRSVLNAAMVLLIDHGLASSTFAARLAASTRADPYSIVSAGLGVMGGALHGGASSDVHALLLTAQDSSDLKRTVGDTRRRLGLLPGFGHAVYKVSDPRFESLMKRVKLAWRGDPRLGVIDRVQRVIAERTGKIPNVDSALGALTYLAGMDARAGELIFAISRTAGWLAHAMEEYGEAPLRFRSRARYIGEVAK